MEPRRPTSVVRFGTYEVSLLSGELRKAGLRIRVQQQPMKLLEMLLERPGEVVTREELRSRVWPNEAFGDFDQALNIAIAKLRSALGDSAENPRFIETLPKRGYRFIADVSVVDAEAGPKRPESVAGDLPAAQTGQKFQGGRLAIAPVATKRQLWPTRWVIPVLALVLSVPILTIWLFHSRGRAPTGIRSLAVLPLDNLSGDASQNYFADGMTDELITDLAQISALRVISRTSVMVYKGAHKPLPQIARELKVDAVVEGTVLRSGDQVRITAQLIEASTDKHLWSQSYEVPLRDTLALQNRVATAIADQIRISLTPQERAALKNVKVVNPEAYESYLKGRYFWNKRTADGLKVALAYFNQAIDEDPKYAQAYSGLADTYALLGDWEYGVLAPKEAYPRAKAAARKALELDDTLSEAHVSLASLGMFDWDWQSAGKEFRRAIELNPGYATAHQWYAWNLNLLGRQSDAIAEMRKAESLDPLSLIISADMADVLFVARLYDQSIEQSRKTLEMDPNFAVARFELGEAYLEKHMYDEAVAELQKAVQLSGGNSTFIANLARAYVLSGKRSEAVELLSNLKKRSNLGHSNSSEIATIYASLGDTDQAMNWLEKGYEERFNPSVLLRPGFNPLRSDPRFQNLVQRIGLPQIRSDNVPEFVSRAIH